MQAVDCRSWDEQGRLPAEALVLLTIKAFHGAEVLAELERRADLATLKLVFLQNGLGLIEEATSRLPELRPENLARGAVWIGARFVEPQLLQIAGNRGIDRAGGERALAALSPIEAYWRHAGIEVRPGVTPHQVEWTKALANLVINGLCALGGAPNRAVVENPGMREIAEQLLLESLEVARSIGIQLPENARQSVFAVAQATGDNLNSTLLDLQAGRPTEVPWLNGKVRAMAQVYGIPVPGHRMISEIFSYLEKERVENGSV